MFRSIDEEHNLQKVVTAVGSAGQRAGSNRPVVKGSVPLIYTIYLHDSNIYRLYMQGLYMLELILKLILELILKLIFGVNLGVYIEVYIGVNIRVNIRVNIGILVFGI